MAGIATIQIVGRLGGDPETKILASGKTVVNFSVAVSKPVKGEDREQTAWYRVACWGYLAERATDLADKGWLCKGRQVFVGGRLEPREWEKDGRTGLSLDVNAVDLELVGSKGDAAPTTVDEVAW